MWFWHSPYELGPDDRATLAQIGVKQLFVRAATISNDGEQVVPVLSQKWSAPSKDKIHLVFNFDGGAIRHFEEFANSAIADEIAKTYARHKEAAERQGITVVGCQLDLDSPTRLLPKYADLLHLLRPKLPKGTKLSITGLTTWLSSDDLPKVLKQLDFWVPQFYESQVPSRLLDRVPVSSQAVLERGMQKAGSLGTPFYVGLATYGQALLYNPKGELEGTYRGLSVYDAARHPSLKLIDASMQDGEANYLFRAVRPAKDGRGLGDQLLYRLSTPSSLLKSVDDVRQHAPNNCVGMILFRISEPGESTAMALKTLQTALAGDTPAPQIKASIETVKLPFGIIEGSSKSLSRAIRIRIENTGSEGTTVGPGALTITLRFDQGALQEASAGNFDQIAPFVGDPSTVGTVSAKRASGLLISRVHLGVGEKITTGRILIADTTKIAGDWTFKTIEGRVMHGALPSR